MAIEFICSDTWTLRKRLSDSLNEALNGTESNDILLIVPGQFTLDAERLALSSADIKGSFRLQVYSLGHFCDIVLDRAGGGDKVYIDDNGSMMLMRMAADSIDKKLGVFEAARTSRTFAFTASACVNSFREAGLSPRDVQKLAADHAGTRLGDKLDDIADMYTAWEELLRRHGVDEESRRAAAFERLKSGAMFKGADVWFYGFDLVTRPIIRCAAALSGSARSVKILCCVEDGAERRLMYSPISDSISRSVKLLASESMPFIINSLPSEERPLNDVRIAERELFNMRVSPRIGKPHGITMYAARNPRDEAEHVAAEVREAVRRCGLRYRDIAVACHGEEELFSQLRRIFRLYGIPIFFPESRPAILHPMCAGLVSALRCASGPVRDGEAESLLALGYSGLSRDETSEVLLFAREHGVNRGRWLTEWHVTENSDASHARFEQLRSKCFDPVARLRKGIRTGATADRLKAVMTYLDETDAYVRVLEESDALINAGDPIRAAEGTQVWTKLIHCLDQIAVLWSDAAPSPKVLSELIEQSLSVTELKPLPQSPDAVTAGSLEHMKGQPVKLLFIIGANDADDSALSGLLTDTERESIENEVWLGPNRRDRSAMRMLAARNAFALALDEIHISWHVSSSEGSARRQGAIVDSIRAIFPDCPTFGGIEDDRLENRLRMMEPNAAIVKAGRAVLKGAPADSDEADILRALSASDVNSSKLSGLARALGGDIIPSRIDPSFAERIYNGPASVSITRLEQFASCPFRHFIRYGAKCKEPVEYGVTPRDYGTFTHEAISRFMKVQPEDLDIESAVKVMDTVTSELISTIYPDITDDDTVSKRDIEEMRGTARRAAQTILGHMGVSRFSPVKAEFDFSGSTSVSAGGSTLYGRIDRIDLWRDDEGKSWLTVVDYKRGGKKADISEIYYGLQLQLLIYLIAAGGIYDAEPAAGLYFNVSDPLVNTRSEDITEIDAERDDELRMNGLILNDETVVRALSDPPETALNVTQNKDGSLRKNERLVSKEDLDLLIRNALRRAEEDITAIKSGLIEAAPVISGRTETCEYCDYAAICRRDPYTRSTKPKRLKHLRSDDVYDRLHDEFLIQGDETN